MRKKSFALVLAFAPTVIVAACTHHDDPAPAVAVDAAASAASATPVVTATPPDAGDTAPDSGGDAGGDAAMEAPASGVCPSGMLLIDGDYCTDLSLKCLKEWYAKWNDKHICETFEEPSKCVGKKDHKRYCIDKFEYPNKEGVRPTVMNDFPMAQRLCADQGKRVCTETEWTMACEGPSYKPYPYGYVRDPTICRGDQNKHEPHVLGKDKAGIAFYAFASNDKKVREDELEYLWEGVPSGSQPKCVSDYGVYDMPGNADELAGSESPDAKFDNVTTGGPWRYGVRNQCRPKIYTHNEGFAYYYLSFRCCAETDGKPSDPRAPRQIKRNEPWRGGQPPVRDSWDGDPLPDPDPTKK